VSTISIANCLKEKEWQKVAKGRECIKA